ncbi:MAG: hypothetical protein ACOX6Y_05480 [Christensenellales bacterium]|jgi:hypothetical protein
MKHAFKRLLALLLLIALLPLFASSETESTLRPFDGFTGSWVQTNASDNPWELELRPDGTGNMKNADQDIPITWRAEIMLDDIVMVEVRDLSGEYFEVFWYKDGVLEGEDKRNFERPQPDFLIEEDYAAAIPGLLSDFEGVWKLTGGVVSIKEPPMTLVISAEDINEMSGGQMPPPIYIGIKNGKLMGRVGNIYMVDPALTCTYTGKAIFATRAGINYTAGYYYVSPGVLHLTGPNPAPDVLDYCIFTLNKTNLEMIPEGSNSWNFVPPAP